MPNQVFISHSKRDRDLVQGISEVFSRTNLRMITEEFEDLNAPASDDINRDIEGSVALLLLLGPNAQNLTREDLGHTRDWIAWELGVASNTNPSTPIWLFEDLDHPAEMAIPHLTDYVLWSSNDEEQWRELRDLIEAEYVTPNQQALRGAIIGTIVGYALGGSEGALAGGIGGVVLGGTKQTASPRVECPNCHQTFRVRTQVEQLVCPTCREGRIDLEWGEGDSFE